MLVVQAWPTRLLQTVQEMHQEGWHAWTWSLTCRASSEWNWIVIAGLGHDQVVQGSLCTAWKTCAAPEWLRLHLGYLLTAALGQGLHACLGSLRA